MRPLAGGPAPRSPAALVLIAAAALAGIAGFALLGVWQVQRLGWKRDLIARVEARVHAPPVAAPAPDRWTHVAGEEYRRVRVTGRFLPGRDTLVQAVTERGGGFWVMTPLGTDAGFTVLVNRGFVPADRRDPADRRLPEGAVTVTGLLRLSEPGGGFLRANDPRGDRWFSRDVAAIAAARNLNGTAPYFIDADGTPNSGGFPVGGLTVIRFTNNHLAYALTWFALALMLAAATAFLFRSEMRLRRRVESGGESRRASGVSGGASHSVELQN